MGKKFDPKLSKHSRFIETKFCEVDGVEVTINELLEAVNDLEQCDDQIDIAVITNDKLHDKLEELEIIETTTDGRATTGKNFDQFYKQFFDLLDQKN